MSILIKGIDIPKSCMKCEIGFTYELSEICPFAKNPCGGYKGKRHEDCPITEIPKHGRLIDADALLRGDGRYIITFGKEGIDIEEIERAPTILEAEE